MDERRQLLGQALARFARVTQGYAIRQRHGGAVHIAAKRFEDAARSLAEQLASVVESKENEQRAEEAQ